jgi:hypothetical protein
MRVVSAVGAAEVGAGFVAARLGGFAFRALVFGELFVGVGEGIARSEHGIGAAGLLLFLAQGAELMADLAERRFNGFYFDEEVTDLFKEVVKMVRANDVGHMVDLEMADVLASARFRDEVESPDPAAIFRGDASELAKGDESRAINAGDGHIGDDQGPLPSLEFREKLMSVLDVSDAPAFGVEDLFDRTGALGIVVEDKDANLGGRDRGISTHRTSIDPKLCEKHQEWPRLHPIG